MNRYLCPIEEQIEATIKNRNLKGQSWGANLPCEDCMATAEFSVDPDNSYEYRIYGRCALAKEAPTVMLPAHFDPVSFTNGMLSAAGRLMGLEHPLATSND